MMDKGVNVALPIAWFYLHDRITNTLYLRLLPPNSKYSENYLQSQAPLEYKEKLKLIPGMRIGPAFPGYR